MVLNASHHKYLSLAEIQKQYRVTYDSDQRMAFIVHRSDNGLPDMIFQMHPSGLHYYDPSDNGNYVFVSTVEQNKMNFTKRQIEAAEKARQLYASVGFPSNRDFKWMNQTN